MTDSKGRPDARLVWLLGWILALGTLACYWPARHFDFINLDDGLYVSHNPNLEGGFSWRGLAWAFTTTEGGNWNPLVWLSHMADCQLFGLKPGGHHLTNVALHAANALLLFLVLNRMTGTIWRSAFAAAIFAWHPMHVESVCWISERKDVLSAFFFLTTIWAYAVFVRAEKNRRKVFYFLALLLFALGLMSKPMLVTLPGVLLLLDYWPLRRSEPAKRLVAEKLPFIFLTVAACIVAVFAQRHAGAMENVPPFPLRLENAVVSCATYLLKLFWPVDLAIFYPFPGSISLWRVIGAAVLLGGVTGAVVWKIKDYRYLGVAWFWFLGTLVPVIGLVQVGMQGWADRFSYIPYMGLGVAISWGLFDLAGAFPKARLAVIPVAALALVALAAATFEQAQYWRNTATVFEHALKVTSGNYIAHNSLGDMLLDENKYDEAIDQYKVVLQLKPNVAIPYNSLGKAYAQAGKLDTAIAMFSNAIALNPHFSAAHINLGNADLLNGKTAEGIAEYKTGLRLNPNDPAAAQKLVKTLIKEGKAAEAIPYCEAGVRADPQNPRTYFALGWAYSESKQSGQAIASYKEALRLAPDSPQCLNALAWVYATTTNAAMRNGVEAVNLATRACEITRYQNIEMLDTLAAAYAEAGEFNEAVKTVEKIRPLANSAHDDTALEMLRGRLELYKAGKPYRDDQ